MEEKKEIENIKKYIIEGCNFDGITDLFQEDCILLNKIFEQLQLKDNQIKDLQSSIDYIAKSLDCVPLDKYGNLDCIDVAIRDMKYSIQLKDKMIEKAKETFTFLLKGECYPSPARHSIEQALAELRGE